MEATRMPIGKVCGSTEKFVTHIDTELCDVSAMQLGTRMHFLREKLGSGSIKPESWFHWFSRVIGYGDGGIRRQDIIICGT